MGLLVEDIPHHHGDVRRSSAPDLHFADGQVAVGCTWISVELQVVNPACRNQARLPELKDAKALGTMAVSMSDLPVSACVEIWVAMLPSAVLSSQLLLAADVEGPTASQAQAVVAVALRHSAPAAHMPAVGSASAASAQNTNKRGNWQS